MTYSTTPAPIVTPTHINPFEAEGAYRREMLMYLGHGYIGVEVPSGVDDGTVMKYLHLGPGWFGGEGYRIETKPLPYSVHIMAESYSTAKANAELVDIWKAHEAIRKSGGENWNLVNNCWFPVWAHWYHGGVYTFSEPMESGVDIGGP